MFLKVKTVWQWRRWQWIPDDESWNCESSLRDFSPCSRQDKVWRIRRTYGTWSDLDLQQVGEVRQVPSLQRLRWWALSCTRCAVWSAASEVSRGVALHPIVHDTNRPLLPGYSAPSEVC